MSRIVSFWDEQRAIHESAIQRLCDLVLPVPFEKSALPFQIFVKASTWSVEMG